MICTVKLDEEKAKHAGLAQENRFGSAHSAVAGKRHSCCTGFMGEVNIYIYIEGR